MRAIGLTLLLLTLVTPAPDASAASKRECKAACAQQILACEDVCVPFGGGFAAPGGQKLVRGCRAGVLKRCRREGVQTCETAATTTTTVPSGSTTTTVAGTSSTTTTVIVTTSTMPPTTTTTTAPPSGLAGLIGRWRFQFTIISTFTEDYDLDHVETVGGIPTLIGFDSFGDPVIVNRTADLGGGVPYDFAMLDPGIILCDFYLFNRTGTTTISGEHWQTDVAFDGSCDSLTFGPDPLTGTRLSALLGSVRRETATDRLAVETMRVDEASGSATVTDEAREGILQRMEDQLQ
jgi:hypothetical protein